METRRGVDSARDGLDGPRAFVVEQWEWLRRAAYAVERPALAMILRAASLEFEIDEADLERGIARAVDLFIEEMSGPFDNALDPMRDPLECDAFDARDRLERRLAIAARAAVDTGTPVGHAEASALDGDDDAVDNARDEVGARAADAAETALFDHGDPLVLIPSRLDERAA